MREATEEVPKCIAALNALRALGFSSLYDAEECYVTDARDLLNVFNSQQDTIKALEDRLQIQRNLTQDWEGKAAELDAQLNAALERIGELETENGQLLSEIHELRARTKDTP